MEHHFVTGEAVIPLNGCELRAVHPEQVAGARDLLPARCGLAHATLQVEPDDHHGCDEVNW